ncbi:membrane fusion protein, cobalt-zinc-cadmium efflux system [Flexibacter flexilis DSM 6793]|uniref:Membrane fusion protein, cobalt-zinc-cadmium efflux system n=1 Tax=Flexibacter flexilis DSM 6793 TaxID=927664 RepID=A0A1I1G1R6_9BACT|nr:efflux RND transporter periplasmic adaptor subunit [Flexibacter flexilis]SFC05256.1 membrane fusion protein, cobalt-zinc-cadmium efflux system [Flexibacter flexilis DSM 6793]
MKNLIFVYISALFLLGSCGKKAENTAQETEKETIETEVTLTDAQIKTSGIQLGEITPKSISSTLKVNGVIDVPPQNLVSISAPLGGYLKSTKLLPGMHVSKNEVIAIMEDQQYIQLQQDFLTAKNMLGLLEKDLQRQKELNASNAASDKVYQQALADFQSEKIKLKALKEKLLIIGINPEKLTADNISKSVNIKSPIEGYVSVVNVNIGKYVAPTEVLFELINPTDIHLNLSVFEQDLSKIKLGQKLYAYTNADPTNKHLCEIILIGKNLSASRNVEVHCHFEQYDHTLIPGMFMNAEIETRNAAVSALPEEAIVHYENKDYVFVAENAHKFQMVEVKTGGEEEGFVEIKNAKDLPSEKQKIVYKGAYSLLMKLKNVAEEE